MRSKSATLVGVVLAVSLGLGIAGCKPKIDGKYTAAEGAVSIEFKSGKATLSGMGQSETADYTVDGDKITVKTKDSGDVVFTIQPDGSIQGNGVTFKKAAS